MGNTTYGYSTLAKLEAHAKRDYSLIDATLYADTPVESSISDAESWINGQVGHTWTGTTYNSGGAGTSIPAPITLLTNVVAAFFLGQTIQERTKGVADGAILKHLKDLSLDYIIDDYRAEYKDTRTIWWT